MPRRRKRSPQTEFFNKEGELWKYGPAIPDAEPIGNLIYKLKAIEVRHCRGPDGEQQYGCLLPRHFLEQGRRRLEMMARGKGRPEKSEGEKQFARLAAQADVERERDKIERSTGKRRGSLTAAKAVIERRDNISTRAVDKRRGK